jgi:hypothetical protein
MVNGVDGSHEVLAAGSVASVEGKQKSPAAGYNTRIGRKRGSKPCPLPWDSVFFIEHTDFQIGQHPLQI